MFPARSPRFVACCALAASAALLLSSCGSDNKFPTHPVSGRVLVKGQALADVMIALHPLDEAKYKTERPVAYTDKEGNFKLTTYSHGDGAPEGEYKLTVMMRPNDGEGGDQPTSKKKIDWKYARPNTTPLKATVKPGDNVLETVNVN